MSEVVHIAIVSEDAPLRAATARVLGRAGWLVSEVWDAEACLGLLRQQDIAVVVIDLAHPGDGGRSLLSEVSGGFADVSVVALGPDDVTAAVQSMQRGACDYVALRSDDAHLQELPQVIWRALGRRRRLRAQRRARTEPEALATALRGTSDGVAIVDTIGRVSFVNPALAQAWGGSAPKIVGRSISEFVCVPGDADGLASVLSHAEASGRWAGRLRPRREATGAWDVTLTPIVRPRAASALVGIFREARSCEDAAQVRSDLLSMVTHDIKSPLAVILGYTDLLSDSGGASPAVLGETLTRIRESGEKINALVTNFLEVSRIEAGELALERRSSDLRLLVDRLVDQHASRAEREGVSLEVGGSTPPPMAVDPNYLERALQNVLSNAIKYTPQGGRVTVTVAHDDTTVEVRVADTGPGIAPDDLPVIFEKYRRGRSTGRQEGTGLGLFIARRIVEAHRGTLTAASVLGEGSLFTVRLPLG